MVFKEASLPIRPKEDPNSNYPLTQKPLDNPYAQPSAISRFNYSHLDNQQTVGRVSYNSLDYHRDKKQGLYSSSGSYRMAA